MKKFLFFFMGVAIMFIFSSCNRSGDNSNNMGMMALLGLGPNAGFRVVGTTPASGATDVMRNTNIVVNFSTDVDSGTVSGTTFQISPTVAGSLSAIGNTATFNPDDNLDADTTYTVTLATGIQSDEAESQALKSDYVFSFTTGSATDSTPPTVSSTYPTGGATDVSRTPTITVTFSEPIVGDVSDVSIDNGATVDNVSVVGNVMTITIDGNLDYDTEYTVTIDSGAGGVTDIAGNPLASDYDFSFTTIEEPASLQVIGNDPLDGDTGVSVHTSILVGFDADINSGTLNSSTFQVSGGGGTVTGSLGSSANIVLFTPSSPLSYNTEYTVTITTGLRSTGGDSLASSYSFSFTTTASADTTPPVVQYTSPSDGSSVTAASMYMDPYYFIGVTFDDELDATTVTSSSFQVSCNGSPITPFAVGAVLDQAIFIFTGVPAAGAYSVTLTTDIENLDGLNMDSDYNFSFTVTP